MVKYTLNIGKDIVVITPELKDKYPKMLDIDSNNNVLKKVQKQKSVYIYLDDDDKESIPVGKGILKDDKVIPLNKVENLTAFENKECSADDIWNYSVCGTYKVLKTTIELKDNQAISFIWALSKGYQNLYRGFLIKRGSEYFLVKTSIGTIAELSKSFTIVNDNVKEQKETANPLQQLKDFGIE